MTPLPPKPGPLVIRKYANRRFYDTTRSCNVTQHDLHELIVDGYDVVVTDASSGEDITNVVLTHIILEHHSAKLAIFPAGVLQQIIRTQQQFLGGVVEQFFRQAIESQIATQQQWSQFLQRTFGMPTSAVDPFAWMRPRPGAAPPSSGVAPASAAAPPTPAQANPADAAIPEDEVDELRRRIAELSAQIERLAPGSPLPK